jgi:hypothetical protein
MGIYLKDKGIALKTKIAANKNTIKEKSASHFTVCKIVYEVVQQRFNFGYK